MIYQEQWHIIIGLAFLYSFLPAPDFDWCCGFSCIKVIRVSSEAIGGFTKMLSKPYIHVPLTFGICLILLVVLFLTPQINKLQSEIHQPLIEADVATAAFIAEINGFIQTVPAEVISWVNTEIQVAWTKVRSTLKTTMLDLFGDVNTVIENDVEFPINQFLNSLDNSLSISFPTFGVEDSPISIPTVFIPNIPNIPIQDLTIPTTLLALNPPTSPWIDDRVQELRVIANSILQFGIWLVVLTGIALCLAFGKAFIPHGVNEFFKHPDFYEKDNVDKPTSKLSNKSEMSDRQLP